MDERDDEIVILGDEPLAPGEPAERVPVIDDERDDDVLPEHAELQADGSVRLPLLRPVVLRWKKSSSDQVRENRFDELVMHRFTGADMMAIQSNGAGSAAVAAIGRSARIALQRMKPLYELMDGADIQAAGQVCSFFLSPGRRTGRPSSPR